MKQSGIHRRGLLKGFAAGAAATVIGFDPASRSWITSAEAAPPTTISIPGLDGELLLDAASRAGAAQDFGLLFTRTPVAVLAPGSVEDIRKVIKFANQHHLKVAGRGAAHMTFGQGLVEGGIAIDMKTLDAIHEINEGDMLVDAGCVWSDVIQTALADGQTPPVVTDYIETTVGGVLNAAGIGGATHREGFVVDNVLELEVVTGDGKRFWCSRSQRAGLFRACLGGLGQYAIITKARLRLVPAETMARTYLLTYADANQYVADQTMLAQEERFSYLEGQVIPDGTGGWLYMIEASIYYTPPAAPNDAALLAGLSGSSPTITDTTYFDWLNRLAPQVAFLKSVGAWDIPHPFYDVFLPGNKAASYVAGVLSTLTLDQTGGGPILFYPFKRSRLSSTLVPVPNREVLFLFDILKFIPPIPGAVDAAIAHNRALFVDARNKGGKRYAISSIPFSVVDWIQHYGPEYGFALLQKFLHDPKRVLTPGPGIFGTTDNDC